MKVKTIFYSLEGNTKMVAEAISNSIGADVLELKPIKEYHTKGFKKYLWNGKSIMLKEKPTLESYDKNLDYDLIIFGSPIWAGTFSPPIRTFISENDLSGKKVAFFVCHMGGGASRCFTEFKALQPNCELISTLDFYEPTKNSTKEQLDKAVSWAKNISKAESK